MVLGSCLVANAAVERAQAEVAVGDEGAHASGFSRVVNPEAPVSDQRMKATKLLHDFRRTAVRNLERAGVPRSVAMKLTGHKTEAVYRRYAIVAEADLAEGVAKLAELHQRRPANQGKVIPLLRRLVVTPGVTRAGAEVSSARRAQLQQTCVLFGAGGGSRTLTRLAT